MYHLPKLDLIVIGRCESTCKSEQDSYRRFLPPVQPYYGMPNFSFCTSVCVPQAEARLAAKRAARAEAREIRMRELERQQKEVKNPSDV